jgi:hypothetical protein
MTLPPPRGRLVMSALWLYRIDPVVISTCVWAIKVPRCFPAFKAAVMPLLGDAFSIGEVEMCVHRAPP